MKVILCLALFISLSLAAVVTTRSITLDELVKIRCSLNVEEETFFFFNGTMVAYLPTGNTFPLFNTIGINVGRCFKNTDGTYTLASRELLYYLDFRTGAIIDTWNNPWTGRANLTVAHVDNDPVLQQFSASMVSRAKLQVYGDNAFLNLDIPLYYTNPLAANATFAPYSPQPMYQAGEFFKFVFPVANLDEDKSTVDYSLVSWTRQGPFLPWMAMGNMEGHLIYSSSGARIPSWEYLPEGVKADLENRIPHYKHAPECSPNTTSVTSWTFFGEHYAEWLARERFPLTEAAQYPCFPGTEINPSPSPSPSATPSDSPSPSPSPSASTTVSSSASRVASLVSFVRGFFQA